MITEYNTEQEGQIDFFNNYGIDYTNDNSILIENTDGVYNGNILEFKLNISNRNEVLLQAIKYLSRLRIKGYSVPATIILIELNEKKAYIYKSIDYIEYIQKVYVGAASKNNKNFSDNDPYKILNYSDMNKSNELKHILKDKKEREKKYIPIDIDENCVLGWAERYYRENPKAKKSDFIGDYEGKVKVLGEIREPKCFKHLINPYKEKTNQKFKYLLDCLNDRLSKKDLGAFYTPMEYAKKAVELVKKAVNNIPEGNEYIILDRCAGTGNLESALIGNKDKWGKELISNCVVSTYEYYEYKVLNERLGDQVKEIIPPTEADIEYSDGKIFNADAMSEDFLRNPILLKYIENPKCSIILFENPPYDDTSSIRAIYNEKGEKHKTRNKESFIFKQMKKNKDKFRNSNISTVRDFANRFIWSGFEYYLRKRGDSYILFSPVKYFKTLGIFDNASERFNEGFLFNRKYFHASPSSIGCILWNFEPKNKKKEYLLKVYDINKNNELEYLKDQVIKETNTTLSSSNDKYKGTILGNIACDSKGREILNKKIETEVYLDDEIIGYFCPVSASFDIGRLPYFNGRGNYITKSNYQKICCLFAAKMYPFSDWYEKDSIFITYDKGDCFLEDKEFIKKCFIFTCLSKKNKSFSFIASNNITYRNELCFDKKSFSFIELKIFDLNEEEKELIKLWDKIFKEIQKTKNYNSNFSYGIYQIVEELNTYDEIKIKGKKRKKYHYNKLNGDLEALNRKLKEYYEKNIIQDLFKYELLK